MSRKISQIFVFFKGFDGWLTAAVFLLSLFGMAALYSFGLGRPDSNFLELKKQAFFLAAGIFLMAAAAGVNYVFYRSLARVFYVFSLFFLLAVLFFGVTARGTRGWFNFFGFSFQPAEMMKIGLILILALFISRRARGFKTAEFFSGSLLLAVLPTVLVLLQPDFGSALLLILIWLALVLIAGASKKKLLALILAAGILFSVGWLGLFKEYQKERFSTFLNPGRDPLGRGYNLTQSVIAVGSGRFFGRGLGYGSQSQLRFLPEAQTDFIFAVIAEELGWMGGSLVAALFALLFYRLLKIARQAKDDFALFAVLGVLALFFLQFAINVGMNLGLAPVTGLPLPFLSAGGSSLVVNFLLVGIVQSIAKSGQAKRE